MRFELLPPVPAVTLARQLRQIPLFRFASVDELFRISSIARQVRYDERALVQERGTSAQYIQVLVQGRLRVENGRGDDRIVSPPGLLGIREVLEGSALSENASAEEESVALVMPAEEFRTLLSANIEVAQGLFRMYLESSDGGALGEPMRLGIEPRPGELKTVDKVIYLQSLPILSRATAPEIYALAAIAREIDLEADGKLFSAGDPPAILLLLSGEMSLDAPDAPFERVGAGTCLGFAETLAGTEWGRTGRMIAPGKALRIEREALLDLLSDRMELLQGIFGAIFRRRVDADGTTAA